MFFLLGAEAVGEVIVTAAVFFLGDRGGGVLHHRLPYHFGQEIHLPFRIGNVLVDEIGVRQRFLHIPKGIEGCLAVGKVDGEHFKELLFDLRFGEVCGGAFDLIMELVNALPHQTAVLVGGVPGDGRIPCTAIPTEDLCGERRVAEGSLRGGGLYANNANRFRYRRKKSSNHNGFWFFSCLFFEELSGLLQSPEKYENTLRSLLTSLLFFIDDSIKLPVISNSTVLRAIDLIQQQAATVTTAQLARELCLNESHFIRIFKQQLGVPPMQYIRSCKIAKGLNLLQNGMSITAASEECGYSSPVAFSNAFKSENGVLPSHHMKRNEAQKIVGAFAPTIFI